MANPRLTAAKRLFEGTDAELAKRLAGPTVSADVALLWNLSRGLHLLTEGLDEELSEIRAALDKLSRFPRRVK